MTAKEYNTALLQANKLKLISGKMHDIPAIFLKNALQGAEMISTERYSAFLEQGIKLQQDITVFSENIQTASSTILVLAGKMRNQETSSDAGEQNPDRMISGDQTELFSQNDSSAEQKMQDSGSDSVHPSGCEFIPDSIHDSGPVYSDHETDHTGISCLINASTYLKDTDVMISEIISQLQALSDRSIWERIIKNLEMLAQKPQQYRTQLQILQAELEKKGDFSIHETEYHREQTVSVEDLEARTDRACADIELNNLKKNLNGEEVPAPDTEKIQSRLADLEAELTQTPENSIETEISCDSISEMEPEPENNCDDTSAAGQKGLSEQDSETVSENIPGQNVPDNQSPDHIQKTSFEPEDIRKQIDRWVSENCSALGENEQALIRQILYQAAEQAGNTAVLEKAFRNFPTKEEHYRRNFLMPFDKLPANPVEAAKQGWDNSVSANCHQFRARLGRNEKWISPDGHYEAVYDPFGNLVTVPEDRGTYNIADPRKDMLGHCIDDMLPWIMYGNTKEDTTLPLQRLLSIANFL